MRTTTVRRLGRRRVVATAVAFAVPAVLVLGFGHRGTHAARSLLFPGAGLVEERPLLAVALAAAGVVATVGWIRWGVDWALAAVVVGAMAVSFVATPTAHGGTGPVGPPVLGAAHEFPLVILVVAALGWLRALAWRLPGARSVAARRAARRVRQGLDDTARLGPVGRSRCAALVALAGAGAAPGAATALAAGTDDGVVRRARRIGLVARGRRGDPFAVDHAAARAALALAGRLDAPARERFVADARTATAGVPASEPGWVRPLDGTLAALALVRSGDDGAGERWGAMLDGPLARRRSHRPAWWWTPLGVAAGSAPAWEHAATTALAHGAGWIDASDWPLLRARVLGAAARGTAVPADERLVAAGRLWLALVTDEQAARIVARPTVRHDPLAVALDALARRVAADPGALAGRPAAVAVPSSGHAAAGDRGPASSERETR